MRISNAQSDGVGVATGGGIGDGRSVRRARSKDSRTAGSPMEVNGCRLPRIVFILVARAVPCCFTRSDQQIQQPSSLLGVLFPVVLELCTVSRISGTTEPQRRG